MATGDRSRRGAAALLVLSAIIALALFLALRPLDVETPASGSAQALLRFDTELGATVEPVDHTAAASLGLRSGHSALVVTSVAGGGPAEAAGLRVGDVIERIGGRPASEQLVHASTLPPAEPLSIWRAGKPVVLNVRLGAKSLG